MRRRDNERGIGARLGEQSLAMQIGSGIIVPLGLFALHPTSDTAKMAGVLMGIFALFPIEEKYIRFDVHATVLKQILKFTIGAAVIIGLRVGLKAIFPEQMIFDLIRYAAIGAWASLGAPWVFVKLGLAEKTVNPQPSTVNPIRTVA